MSTEKNLSQMGTDKKLVEICANPFVVCANLR